ncbi:Modification methylase HhaI [Streptomyces sp. YIM 121038]|uniref:DNA cytosine methyltransferase n=1 Tax=Streptomyces sp. YIM 121038 TaxID=2136401 RepID=UPI001110551C|nr:DNA cytosine methyltransferase [Streptomyces sp. YIM 121038]QCX74926.1 Modification methylase HhaI [Streptomyces sp. YIM 121038]
MNHPTDIRHTSGAPPRIVALCAGYGGLETAIRAGIGGRVAAYAENDPHAAAVFAAHHPAVPNLGDITAMDWHQVRDQYAPDVISAGFPCRNISNAGRRDGINGQWSRVWKNVAQAVGYLRPRLVFLENVAALRSRGLDVVAQDLAALGYDARWTCLRAGDPETGAPHERDRWFALAYPAAEDPHGAAWGQWRPAAAGEAEGGRARADAGGRGGLPAAAPARRLRLLPTPKASDGPHGGPNQRDTSGRYYLPGQAVRLDERWVATDGTDYGPAIRRWEHLTGRAAPCPTEPGARGNRRLSPAFAEWMMGLPAGWVTAVPGIPRKEQLRIIGNGVVPQQAHHAYGLLLGATAAPALEVAA